MKDENIKLLIKNEYENGTSMSVLAKKYNVKLNTIKTWSAKEKWIKKKRNTTTKKGTTKNSEKQPKKTVVIDKETQIKSDILNNVPKEKILQKFSVTERTYYNKVKSVREIQIEKSQSILTKIADENYNDLKEQLLELENEKRKLKEKFLEIGLEDDETLKRINTRLKVLKEFEKEIYKGGQIVGSYRQAELEEQLVNNELSRNALEIQKERLEIEKAKIKKDDDKDSEKEREMIELLKNITKKVEKDE
mgnify:CR=1 FL=1|jgi:hypothetical protein|nr:MAG TPA: InsA C-terminal domain [Caudoviricetes sp.]